MGLVFVDPFKLYCEVKMEVQILSLPLFQTLLSKSKETIPYPLFGKVVG